MNIGTERGRPKLNPKHSQLHYLSNQVSPTSLSSSSSHPKDNSSSSSGSKSLSIWYNLSESQHYRSLVIYLIHFPENGIRVAKFQVINPTGLLLHRTIESYQSRSISAMDLISRMINSRRLQGR
jgi:hypothetical protein